MPFILILEDDLTFSLMLSTWLKKKNIAVSCAATVGEAKQKVESERFDLILSDLRLPDGDGIDLLKWIRGKGYYIPFIIMTGYAEIETAVQSIKLGASDYIAKPLNPDDLWKKISELIPPRQPAVPAVEPVEGKCPAVKQMYKHIRLVAPTDMSVLITGSSGTGKEYAARLIHEQSKRCKAPFIAIDCGAIAKELALSEFFGHIKGSFTGAVDNKTGAFEAAHGGTIFLDEIGNLTYEVQIQLLRALQERTVKRVGSNRQVKIDIRLISATNENLHAAIGGGCFREDLYHRINEFAVRIPDLRERRDDILLFAGHFLDVANRELQKHVAGFDRETIQLFLSHPWPGNLRQMKNVIRYATLLVTGDCITVNELPQEMMAPAGHVAATSPLRDEAHERDHIMKALREAENNKALAARTLGIDRKTLYNKLKSYRTD
ncbi:MAG: sigma-54 dependent transcriptional regulator [Tannerellaceae bacterium]|jgi:two-component system response regulator HydG|nr:sigma-54 dependent transcriptional regulator [Tannerellaceae bacterium]